MGYINPIIPHHGYYGYTASNVITIPNLYQSLEDCTKGKMWKDSVVGFDQYSEFQIYDINKRVNGDGSFYFNDFYHTIINERGKPRLVCSLTIRDRVIQKCINRNFLIPAFFPTIIYDNVASIKHRGLDMALNRLKYHFMRAYHKWGRNFYIAKLDIKSYFDSIPHDYCKWLISTKTIDPQLRHIFDMLFRKYKYDKFIHNGDQVDYGIGLGGEIPQTFGIITLNEFDHIIKEKYLIKEYIRYMDDCILIHNDKTYLEYIIAELSQYLSILGLQFNMHKTHVYNAEEGVLFLKFHYKITETGKIYLLGYKPNFRRERRKLRKLRALLIADNINILDIKSSYYSWRGHMLKGNTLSYINYFDQLYEDLNIIGRVKDIFYRCNNIDDYNDLIYANYMESKLYDINNTGFIFEIEV